MRADTNFLNQRTAIEANLYSDPVSREVFENFNAQIGEVAWHSVHVDGTLDEVSDAHAAEMLRVINDHKLLKPRVLEIGAYAHHSAQIVASKSEGFAVSHDISKASLLEGTRRAGVRSFNGEHVAVAGDFHDLPFCDDWFDLVFVASSVHHTWRPWEVMEELLRVARPGGIVHISNEPIGRTAGLYAFRGNRIDDRSPFEKAIEALGLTATISSPFPGSRAEALFGIIENDRIPLHVYQRTLLRESIEVKDWHLNFVGTVGVFENWLLDTSPNAVQIHKRLVDNIRGVAHLFSKRDSMCGLVVPSDDELWPLCYHLAERLEVYKASSSDNKRDLKANLFGAALTATLKKKRSISVGRKAIDRVFSGSNNIAMFKRPVLEDGGVFRDLPKSTNISLDLENALAKTDVVTDLFPATDWAQIVEESGIRTICNLKGLGAIKADSGLGVLILRTYSVATELPYFFDVLVDGNLVYSHCVSASESHLAKCVIQPGADVQVRLHSGDEVPLDIPLHSRIISRFIGIEQVTVGEAFA